MSEQNSLETHVILCELRYKQLDLRMDRIEQRMDDFATDLKAVKCQMNTSFDEIKTMLTAGKDEKFKTMVTVTGTIIVALLGTMGYLITHIK